jgi:two-component system LytT family response regulator
MSKRKTTPIQQSNTIKLGTKFIVPSEIKYIEGEGNYSILHFTNGEKILSCRTLKYFETLLEKIPIIRPSKSYLVNVTHVKSVELKSKKSIIMNDEFAIGISRRNVPLMKAYFNL